MPALTRPVPFSLRFCLSEGSVSAQLSQGDPGVFPVTSFHTVPTATEALS